MASSEFPLLDVEDDVWTGSAVGNTQGDVMVGGPGSYALHATLLEQGAQRTDIAAQWPLSHSSWLSDHGG